MIALVAVLALVVVQVADAVTALTMGPHMREVNPIAARLLSDPVHVLATKLALASFVTTTSAMVWVFHPRVAWLVMGVGIAAGVVGLTSNLVPVVVL